MAMPHKKAYYIKHIPQNIYTIEEPIPLKTNSTNQPYQIKKYYKDGNATQESIPHKTHTTKYLYHRVVHSTEGLILQTNHTN